MSKAIGLDKRLHLPACRHHQFITERCNRSPDAPIRFPRHNTLCVMRSYLSMAFTNLSCSVSVHFSLGLLILYLHCGHAYQSLCQQDSIQRWDASPSCKSRGTSSHLLSPPRRSVRSIAQYSVFCTISSSSWAWMNSESQEQLWFTILSQFWLWQLNSTKNLPPWDGKYLTNLRTLPVSITSHDIAISGAIKTVSNTRNPIDRLLVPAELHVIALPTTHGISQAIARASAPPEGSIRTNLRWAYQTKHKKTLKVSMAPHGIIRAGFNV